MSGEIICMASLMLEFRSFPAAPAGSISVIFAYMNCVLMQLEIREVPMRNVIKKFYLFPTLCIN